MLPKDLVKVQKPYIGKKNAAKENQLPHFAPFPVNLAFQLHQVDSQVSSLVSRFFFRTHNIEEIVLFTFVIGKFYG